MLNRGKMHRISQMEILYKEIEDELLNTKEGDDNDINLNIPPNLIISKRGDQTILHDQSDYIALESLSPSKKTIDKNKSS